MNFNFYKKEYPNGQYLYHLEVDKMSDAEYDRLKPFIEILGGHWRERYKCFVFRNDVSHLLTEENLNNLSIPEKYRWQEETQFFPTPNAVAKRAVELAEVVDSNTVLEPSAGQGAITDVIPTTCIIECVELLEENANVLIQKGYNTHICSFEDYWNPDKKFDRIIMNPPFSGQRDIKHVLMAYEMLKSDGILVAIISENALYYETELTKQFKKFLMKHNAYIEAVPSYAFEDSGTTIETIIIKIKGGDF